MQRLSQVLEIQGAGKSPADGDLPLHVFEREVGALTLHIDMALHIHGADGFAVVHFHAGVAAQAGQAHVSVGASQHDIAVDIADLEIAAPTRIERPITSADQQVIAFGHYLDWRVVVGAVRILPPKTADHFVAAHRNLLRIGAGHLDIAARDVEDDAPHPGGRSLGGDRIVVLIAEDAETFTIPVDAVAVAGPHRRAEKADQYDEHHLATAEAALPGRAGPGDFDQPQHAPEDEQERPVERENLVDGRLRVEIAPQEKAADDDQDERPGERTRSHTAPPGVELSGGVSGLAGLDDAPGSAPAGADPGASSS